MKVELGSGVWIADKSGKTRTLREEKAENFTNVMSAIKALAKAREYRPFKNAVFKSAYMIKNVQFHMHEGYEHDEYVEIKVRDNATDEEIEAIMKKAHEVWMSKKVDGSWEFVNE